MQRHHRAGEVIMEFRYFAMQRLNRGLDEAGRPMFFHRGDEIPAAQFASGQALQAAIHKGMVSAVPVLEGGMDTEQALALGSNPIKEMAGKNVADPVVPPPSLRRRDPYQSGSKP